MIISLIQTRSDMRFEYEFTHKDNVICESYVPIKLTGFQIILQLDNKNVFKIEASSQAELERYFNVDYKARKAYSIKDNEGAIAGYISVRQSSFWNGYLYYEIMFNNEAYTVYEIGRGKEGLFLPVYKNETQAALIEKDLIVYNNKDTYKAYLQEDKDAIPIMLFNVFYDCVRWANRGEYANNKKMYNYIYTTKKDLLNKHDSVFKDKISE